MRWSWRKGSIRVQWLISYLVLLLLPFLFGILIYAFSINEIQEKVGEVWSQSMERTEAVMEGTFDTIGKMGNSILNSGGARALFHENLENSYDLNQRVNLSQLKDAISNALISNDMIDELYVYFPQTGHILNNESVFFAEDEGMFQYWFHNSKKQLLEELGDSLYQTVHIVQRGNSRRLVFTTCTAPTASLAEQEAVILVYLHAPKLRGLLEADGIQTVLWQEGNYLSYGEDLEELEEWRQAWEENASFQQSSYKKGSYYILRLPMQRYRLSILQVIPGKQYLSDIQHLLWMLAGYVLVCLVAGVVLALYFLKRNYAPVKELLSLTRKMNRRGEGEAEFVQIRKLVETLLERYFEGQQESIEQMNTKKSICFYRLLHGKNKYSSISEEDWQTIQENVPGSRYLLYSINLEQVKGEWESSESEMIPEEVRKLLYFVVGNVAEELLAERWHFYGAAVLDSYVFLLNGGEPEEYEGLRKLSGQIDRFLQQHYQVVMSFSISGVHQGRDGIQTCWQEIEALNQYRDQAGEAEAVLLYPEWERERKKEQREQRRQQEAEGQEDIEKGKIEQGDGLLAGENQKETEAAKADAGEETEVVRVAAEEEKGGKGKKKGSRQKAEDQREPALQRAAWQGEAAETKNLADQVAEYIEEHYTDKLLSGGMLADQFGLSQSNLTQKFKRKKDIGVMEYIDYVRLENAKKLLEAGCTVNETADKVGYYNTRPLIRIFRDIEGITPAEYRSMIAGKGAKG